MDNKLQNLIEKYNAKIIGKGIYTDIEEEVPNVEFEVAEFTWPNSGKTELVADLGEFQVQFRGSADDIQALSKGDNEKGTFLIVSSPDGSDQFKVAKGATKAYMRI